MTFLRFNTAMASRNLEINISVSKNTWKICLYSIPLLKTLPTQKSTPLNTTTKIYEIKGRASMQSSGHVTTLHPIELTLLSPIFSSPVPLPLNTPSPTIYFPVKTYLVTCSATKIAAISLIETG